MQANLHFFQSDLDYVTVIEEPRQEVIANILSFAAAFRSVPISESISLNYVLN
jgi:hypothetical protein